MMSSSTETTMPEEEEETTTADPMMGTMRALEFYKNQIPYCLFEMVQINLTADDINERWDKSYNQSFMMAIKNRGELILSYKYSQPPENGNEDKDQIDLNGNMVIILILFKYSIIPYSKNCQCQKWQNRAENNI